jgi:hypothetical protein
MINKDKAPNEINRYLKKFVLTYMKGSYLNEPEATIIKNMEQLDEVPFDSDWNYLMTLVQLIEDLYAHGGFVSDRNYFRFETGKYQHIQDKGINKMDATYSCCVQALIKNWKEEKAPPFSRGAEPFDIDDL